MALFCLTGYLCMVVFLSQSQTLLFSCFLINTVSYRLLVVLPILFLANAKIVRNGIYFSWCTFVSGKKASTRRSVRGFRQYYMVCKFYRIPELRFSGKFSGILIFPHILFKMVQSMVIWVSFPICKILLKAELKKKCFTTTV